MWMFMLPSFLVWLQLDFDRRSSTQSRWLVVETALSSSPVPVSRNELVTSALPFGDAGDDVGAAEPVGLGEVGRGPLRRMVGVRVVEADDIEPEPRACRWMRTSSSGAML
jgi:hypothetical protein